MIYFLSNIILLLISQAFLIIKHKSIFKAINLINIPWIVFSTISTLGLYDLFIPSNQTLFIISFFLYSLNILYFFYSQNRKILVKINLSIQPRIRLIVFINLIFYIYMLSFFPKIYKIIIESGFANLRSFAFDSSLDLGTTVQLLIFQNIVAPVFLASIIISLSLLPFKRFRGLIFLSILDVALYTLFFAGRYFIIQLGFFFIFSIFLYNLRNFRSLKISLPLLFFAFIIFIFSIIITELRSPNSDFIQTLIIYFSGPFIFLDLVLKNNPFKESLFWGTASFGFIVNILFSIFTLITGLKYNGSNHIITQFTGSPLFISPTVGYFNSMTTILFPLIADFGILGPLIGSILLVILIIKFEKFYNNLYSYFSISFYLYFLFILFNSILNSSFLFPSTGMVFILIIFQILRDQ